MNDFEKQQGTSGGQGLDLRELWTTALKRKWIIIIATLAVFTGAILISFLVRPVYTAVGQVLVEREPNILSFGDVFQIDTFNDEYYQTQYKLLQSRALAGDTIERMKLHENKEFMRAAGRTPGAPGVQTADPATKRILVSRFLAKLSVSPVRKTRLVQVSFSDHDPKLAADILNALFDAYIEMNVERKYQATEQATDFLATQIATVGAEIEANERKLQNYGVSKNIIALSNSENTVIEKLGELNKALTAAQIDRINKETYYNEIRLATPDYIPSALNNTLIQKLGEEYSRLYRDYATRSERFLPDYPEIQTLKVSLDTAKKALEDETRAVINRAYTDLQTALGREQALAAVFNRQRGEAFQLNSNAIQYNSLLIQIQNQKGLLETLMKRKSETDVSSRLKGLRTSNIWIVDRAEIPLGPSSPDKKKNAALGLGLGLFLGLGLAFLYEGLDNSVKDAEDVRKYSGFPVLGTVPAFTANGRRGKREGATEDAPRDVGERLKPDWVPPSEWDGRPEGTRDVAAGNHEPRSMDLIVHFFPESSFAERYRTIRTSLLLSTADSKIGALAVTSSYPQEGKTVTTCNLAAALAQTGKRVLIIDADLRRPRLHRIFGIKNLNGLTGYLAAAVALEDVLHATPIPMLYVINSGPIPPNPAELLGSNKMAALIRQVRESYDFVIVDTPPLLAVSDALVVGSQLDGVILVVQGGKTPRDILGQTREKMASHKVKTLGVIVNKSQEKDFHSSRYSSYDYRVQFPE